MAASDFSAGKLVETGQPYDLALAGDGFFAVRGHDQLFYTRQGQFHSDADGRLVNAQGLALQTQSGADLALRGGKVEVLADGAVLEDGAPVARLAVVDFADRSVLNEAGGTLFTAPADASPDVGTASVRQGMLEASNVSSADETVAIMHAVRRAETAQRLIGVYDDLMGRALTTFGQA